MSSTGSKESTIAAMFGVQDVARVGIVMGILTIIFGMLCLVAPGLAGMSVNVLVAVAMVAAGFARLVFAFKAESFGRGLLVFLFGGLSIAVGAFMFASPALGLSTLTMVLAGYFAADGIVEIIAAFKARPNHGWGWAVVSGLASGVLAIMIMSSWPQSSGWAIGTLVGIRLLFAGWSMLVAGSVGESASQSVIDAATQG